MKTKTKTKTLKPEQYRKVIGSLKRKNTNLEKTYERLLRHINILQTDMSCLRVKCQAEADRNLMLKSELLHSKEEAADYMKVNEVIRGQLRVLQQQIDNNVWFDPKWGCKFFFVTGVRMLWNKAKAKFKRK
jgi:hypothetical protein